MLLAKSKTGSAVVEQLKSASDDSFATALLHSFSRDNEEMRRARALGCSKGERKPLLKYRRCTAATEIVQQWRTGGVCGDVQSAFKLVFVVLQPDAECNVKSARHWSGSRLA